MQGEFAITPLSLIDDKSMGATEVRVYSYHACVADRATRESWWSQTRLAERLGVSRHTVMRAEKKLAESGYIAVRSGGRFRRVVLLDPRPMRVADIEADPVAPVQHESAPMLLDGSTSATVAPMQLLHPCNSTVAPVHNPCSTSATQLSHPCDTLDREDKTQEEKTLQPQPRVREDGPRPTPIPDLPPSVNPGDVDRAHQAWIEAVNQHPELVASGKLRTGGMTLPTAVARDIQAALSAWGGLETWLAGCQVFAGMSQHAVLKSRVTSIHRMAQASSSARHLGPWFHRLANGDPTAEWDRDTRSVRDGGPSRMIPDGCRPYGEDSADDEGEVYVLEVDW